jgi:ribonuclease HI
MNHARLVELLTQEFGKENVKVHNEFHMQVQLEGRKHDVWLNRHGQLKWKLAHSRQPATGGFDRMIERFRGAARAKTDLDDMRAAQELCSTIARVSRIAASHRINRGIFCDAGYKNGKARISVILIDGETVEAKAFPVQANDVNAAEEQAILTALTLREDFTIYTDSRACVQKIDSPRVKWIPREQNRNADSLANMRKRDVHTTNGAGGNPRQAVHTVR